MDTIAVVLEAPERLALSRLALSEPGDEDVVVDVEWSGISTGTERLLYTGRMPPFPGMGYPLVPGYESVGRVAAAGPRRAGARSASACSCRVPAASARSAACSAAPRRGWSSPAPRPCRSTSGSASGRSSWHWRRRRSTRSPAPTLPELIVGHGVLGRLVARLAVAAGGAPVVWELNPARAEGADGYRVLNPADDQRRDYEVVCDVSGDASILDTAIARLAPGGEIVLAGFYSEPLSFAFPPAFMREARIRVAAQWREADLATVNDLVAIGRLSLDGLITHRHDAAQAPPPTAPPSAMPPASR
jgi:3-hydroxyethyl bacteriochlorophyllide a dehydrogenase